MHTAEADPTSILLVNAEPGGGDLVRAALESVTSEIVEVDTISAAIESLGKSHPRLVVSELALPDGSGFALCRHVRETAALRDLPILFLSEWNRESDRILAFECGADDFLGKPFFQRELSSRVQALLRRTSQSTLREEPPAASTHQNVVIDELRQELRIEGTPIKITPKEFALFTTLARSQGRVLSRHDLLVEAWTSGESPTERSIDAHIKSLRKKLGPLRGVIETVRGRGYRYSESGLTDLADLDDEDIDDDLAADTLANLTT